MTSAPEPGHTLNEEFDLMATAADLLAVTQLIGQLSRDDDGTPSSTRALARARALRDALSDRLTRHNASEAPHHGGPSTGRQAAPGRACGAFTVVIPGVAAATVHDTLEEAVQALADILAALPLAATWRDAYVSFLAEPDRVRDFITRDGRMTLPVHIGGTTYRAVIEQAKPAHGQQRGARGRYRGTSTPKGGKGHEDHW